MYKVDEEILVSEYREAIGRAPTDKKIREQKYIADLFIMAYDAFRSGKTLTQVLPWIIEE